MSDATTSPERSDCVEVDVREVGRYADAIAEIHRGERDAIIVKNVFPAELLARVAERLSRGEVAIPAFQPADGRKGVVYGTPLVASGGRVGAYLDDAVLARESWRQLFGESDGLEQPLGRVLTALGGGREVSVPRSGSGRSYLTATMRSLCVGDCLPLHYENGVFGRHADALAEFLPRLDRATLMSFYVPMVVAPSGGELRLYRVTCDADGDSSYIERYGSDDVARPHMEKLGFTVLRPGAGDVLVFDGGRRYHEVTTVRGHTRWTLGGVMAKTRDDRAIHYWS